MVVSKKRMATNSSICVVGSSNTDMVIKAAKLPGPGETVIGGTFLMNPGGKGANQAVAAARLLDSGSGTTDKLNAVTFVAKVGNDIFGRQALQQFQREKIDVSQIVTDTEEPSGVALINVDATGENCITVAPGANGNLRPVEVEPALDAASANCIVLLQLEIPLPTVEYVIRRAHERGLRVILNPAPAQPLTTSVFPCLHLITPNESEAELLTGIRVIDLTTARQAAQKLQEMGVPNVVITLGSKGAYVKTDSYAGLILAPPATALDTTAAGDCFNGALAVAVSEGRAIPDAVAFACKAASISVTRMGAQASAPYRHELDQLPSTVAV